jgi:hypothetical protein
MAEYGKNVDPEFQPVYYKVQMDLYGNVNDWAYALFTSPFAQGDYSDVEHDPVYEFRREFVKYYNEQLLPVYRDLTNQIPELFHDYMQGQMVFEPGKTFYPDANLTLRVAYGKVQGYEPQDGIYYYPQSTLTGIIEKDNPNIFDYDIPQALRDIYATGLYDNQPVCFLATNHTTGGNSGSPVINADGNLIGLNFDRVWEGTQSDVTFDPEICRNISLDVRYLVFVVDKVFHAGAILQEVEFVN